ncbi:hypothetical protein B808_87 [Fructilactobacillus florum 8D]|uniref:ABC-2 type transporter transmembrane domain-containing protein n=1 Tax=Fructilactobacillus florum 8D TaxID=1221538 RepID=W9EMY9_9LACO|nr:ABC transporter permease [Fructilactobacillus florum]ETO41014.1 hypothetical protein B808_87 [Fructilactobacillus florum 8D]
MNFKEFLTSKLTIASIIFVIIYQIIMSIVYIPGYQHVTDHVDRTKVALVNQDHSSQGKKIAQGIKTGIEKQHQSPTVKKYGDVDQATKDLRNKKNLMVIKIPANTTKKIMQGERIPLKFITNPYDDETSLRIASEVQSAVVNSLNTELARAGNIQVITKMLLQTQGKQLIQEKMQQVAAQNPSVVANQQARVATQQQITQQVTQGIEKQAEKYVQSNPVQPKTDHISKKGSANLAIIIGVMLISLGCFISVMSAAILMFSQFENALLKVSSRLQAFLMYEGAFVIISVVGPIIGLLIFKQLVHASTAVFFQMYLQNVLMTFISVQFVSLFTFLLGRIGILINLPLALVQTLVSGAIMPVQLLPAPYQFFYYILPLPNSYQANISILSGVNLDKIPGYDFKLIMMGIIVAGLTLIVIYTRKFHNKINENVS